MPEWLWSVISMNLVAHLRIRQLSDRDLAAAAGVCARGMRDNPIHVQAFGADPLRRQRRLARFFAAVVPLVQRKGTLMGAYDGGVLIAVLGLLPPGACRPTRRDILRLLPSLLTSNSPAGLLRVRRWLSAWARNDPPEHHWHLGPLAVDVAHHGQGVGTRLMLQCNIHIDALGAAAYLETDKSINVIFYERFGFSTMATVSVLGVSNWLMKRPARSLI